MTKGNLMATVLLIQVNITFEGDGLDDNSTFTVRIEQPKGSEHSLGQSEHSGAVADTGSCQIIITPLTRMDHTEINLPTIYFQVDRPGGHEDCRGRALVTFICEGLNIPVSGGGFDIGNHGGKSNSTRNYIPITNGQPQP
jgi:hypothetical protein